MSKEDVKKIIDVVVKETIVKTIVKNNRKKQS